MALLVVFRLCGFVELADVPSSDSFPAASAWIIIWYWFSLVGESLCSPHMLTDLFLASHSVEHCQVPPPGPPFCACTLNSHFLKAIISDTQLTPFCVISHQQSNTIKLTYLSLHFPPILDTFVFLWAVLCECSHTPALSYECCFPLSKLGDCAN